MKKLTILTLFTLFFGCKYTHAMTPDAQAGVVLRGGGYTSERRPLKPKQDVAKQDQKKPKCSCTIL